LVTIRSFLLHQIWSVLVWSARTGRQLFYLRGHKALPTGVSFAPDTATPLSSSRDETVRTYTCKLCIDGSGLIRFAELRIARTG
jgi:hypothetical protein